MIDNPYWEEIRGYLVPSFLSSGIEVDIFRGKDGKWREPVNWETLPTRTTMVKKYSWTISDPATVAFVASQCAGNKVLDPLAGTGYWGYLLRQMGVDIVCTDVNTPSTNPYHRGIEPHVKISRLDARASVMLQKDRTTLLLSWIPYGDPIGWQMLKLFNGSRIIYIGELHDGCCAEDFFFTDLYEKWDKIAEHNPVQWSGIHDYVTVYERKAIEGRKKVLIT